MACFSYTVDLIPFSPNAVELSFDKSATSLEVIVDLPTDYLNQREIEYADIPSQDDLIFWFDFSDPNCYPGSGNYFNNLAGSGYNGEVSLVDSDAFTHILAPNPEEYFVETDYGKAFKLNYGEVFEEPVLTWSNDGPVPEQFTSFLVVQNAFALETILPPDQVSSDVDDLSDVVADALSAGFSIRNGGGLRFSSFGTDYYMYSFPRQEYNGVVYPERWSSYSKLYNLNTAFTKTDFAIDSGFKVYYDPQGRSFIPLVGIQQDFSDPEGAAYIVGSLSKKWFDNDYFGSIGGGTYQIVSTSFDGSDMRVFLNGKFIARLPYANLGVAQPNAIQRWIAGAVTESNGFHIGNKRASQGGTYYAMGLYNRALSDDEQLDIYKHYRRGYERPLHEAVVGLSERARFTMQTVIERGNWARKTGRMEYDIDVDLSDNTYDASLNNPLNAASSSLYIDRSAHEIDMSVCPVEVEKVFAFSINTENLAYSSYDYYGTSGEARSTSTDGVSGSGLVYLGYEVGTVVPVSPMRAIGAPTATPTSGATVISSENNQYTLPTIKGGVYDFVVDWGDGTSSSIDSWDHEDVVHTYPSPGIYGISISGKFEGVMFSRHGSEVDGGTKNVDCLKVLDVKEWGPETYLDIDVKVAPYHPLSTDGDAVFDQSATTGSSDNASSMFDGCVNWNDVSGQKPNFKYISGARRGTSNTQASGGKFWGDSNNLRMFRWNNNMAFDMGVWGPETEPFIGGSNYGHFQFRAVPPGSSDMKLNYHWIDADPGYLAYTSGGFRLADNSGNYVNQTMSFDTTNWTMSPSYSLQSSFTGLRAFDGDVSGLVRPGAKNAYGLFANCISFTGKGVETWDTSTVQSFGTAFQNCDSFNKDVSHFTFGVPCSLSSAFYLCDIFNQSFSDWDVTNVASTDRLVKGSPNYNNGGQAWTNAHWKSNANFSEMFMSTPFNQDVSKWILPSSADVPGGFSMNGTFRGTPFNQPVDTHEENGVTYWDMSNCTRISFMFNLCRSFNQPLDNWDVSNVISMQAAFQQCDVFNQDLSSWDTSSLIGMKEAFYLAQDFDGDLSGWDVSNVTHMTNTFLQAHSFTGRGLSTWSPSSALKSMSQTFYQTNLAADTDLGGWDVSGVTTFDRCFLYTSVFTGVNMDQWNVSSAINMTLMFGYTQAFNADVSGWDVSKVTNMKGMFKGANSFNQDLSSWNLSSLVQNVDVYEIPYSPESSGNFDYSGNSELADGSTGVYSGIAGIFNQSGMSKANLDATISGWCDNPNTPDGSTVPGGELQLDVIPLNNSSASQRLDPATITKMQAKGMTAKYTDGSFVY